MTGLLHAATGAVARAEELLRLVVEECRHRGLVEYSMEPAGALARLYLTSDRIEDALQVTEAPFGVVAAKGIWVWATEIAPVRVSTLAAAARISEAVDLVEKFATGLRGRNAPAPQASLAACRAVLAEARGEHAEAAGLFAGAAAACSALPRPYDALLARERQSCCLLAAGRSEGGLALLTEVYQGLCGLGATGDAARVERSLREYGVTAWQGWRGGRRGYGNQLSPRELEVVRLVVACRAPREIAEELCRSPSTVYSHMESAMRKLGVSSRTALAMRAAETGVAADREAGASPVVS